MNVGTNGNPGRLRTTVHSTIATSAVTNGGATEQPPSPAHDEPDGQQRQPHEREEVVDDGAEKSPCNTSWVIRSPPHSGQFQPVRALNGHGGNPNPG